MADKVFASTVGHYSAGLGGKDRLADFLKTEVGPLSARGQRSS
jgi:hypothetical protein